MKITPLEIRQKAFETVFRGYEKDEVDAFLLSLSQEWERVGANIREQQMKLESTEKELARLREMESSLYKTLKTAEETSNNLIEQANKRADLQLRETQMTTEALLSDARSLAKDMIDEAEAAIKDSYEIIKEQVKDLEQDFKVLQNHRETLISELKNLSSSMLERAERSEKQKFDLDVKVDYKKSINIKEVLEPMNKAFGSIVKTKNSNTPIQKDFAQEEVKVEFSQSVVEVPKPVEPEPKVENPVKNNPPQEKDNSEKSFFDLD
jgi:cell division initiation protein